MPGDPRVIVKINEGVPLGMRISRHSMFRNIVEAVAQRSTCRRAQVGAILVKDGRIISMGYNGSPPGSVHCLDVDCLLDDTGGCIRTIHAEQNVIAWAARNGAATEGTTLYCSFAPCIHCAKLIATAGIKAVIYLYSYRDQRGTELLESLGIEVRRLTP